MTNTAAVDSPSVALSVQVVPASGAKIAADSWIAPEFQTTGANDDAAGLEFALRTKNVNGTPVEDVASQHANAIASGEVISGTLGAIHATTESVAKRVASAGSAPLLQSLTEVARVTTDALLVLECVELPVLLIVSSGRALRSPGKIRILAGRGSVHPLRGS